MKTMKRILTLMFNTAVVLLLLPLMLVFAVFLYAKFVNPGAEKTMEEMTEFLEQRKLPDNGFGGEHGLKITDSGYSSERFFWMDSSHLIFRTNRTASAPKEKMKVLVWDLAVDIIKPLDSDYFISGFRDDKLFFVKRNEVRSKQARAQRYDYFEAEIHELEDIWVVQSEESLTDKQQPPSEQYELTWSGGSLPSFRVKREFREELDLPDHRFKYLWEWGWILRMPRSGPDHWGQSVPEMGFINLGGEIYAEQPGIKVGEMIGLPPREYPDLRIIYIAYLDRYWVANTVYGDLSLTRAMGFVGRDGVFTPYIWPENWPQYSGIPMPTRKGVFWSGKDYRESGGIDKGAFIRDSAGLVHKVIQGTAIAIKMSPDGCQVAFFNTLDEKDRSKSSLKNFSVCSSLIENEVVEDVEY